MKNLIAFVLVILFIVGGAGVLISQGQDRATEAEMKAELAAVHLETARQVALLVNSPDDKVGYDRQQAIRKHTEAVTALQKKYPTLLKDDAFIENMEAKAKTGEKDKAKTAEYRARYDYVKQMYTDYLKSGAYKPILSGVTNGMRYDVVSIKRSNEAGQEGMRWDVIMYGAPPKDQIQLSNMHLDIWVNFDEMETSGKRKGQPKRAIYKADLSPFMPYVYVDKPWEWMPEWPTNVSVGYYIGIPQFDSRSVSVDMTLNGQGRTLGGTVIPYQKEWKRLPVEDSWKGAKGGKWDDPNMQPLSDDDLKEQGITLPEEEDEAAAKAAKK